MAGQTLMHLLISMHIFRNKINPKKRDRCNPSNYRPISILSLLSETLEIAINMNIHQQYLHPERQYRFCMESSTDVITFLLTDSSQVRIF